MKRRIAEVLGPFENLSPDDAAAVVAGLERKEFCGKMMEIRDGEKK